MTTPSDPWAVFELAKSGDLDALRAALDEGFPVDAACEYNGSTALLIACEANQLEVARFLLERGADPNVRHADGYQCWDSTRSPQIRRLLVEHGFTLVIDGDTIARGSWSKRVLSVRTPISQRWQRALTGTALHVEWILLEEPTTHGEARVTFGNTTSRRLVAGEHHRERIDAQSLDLTLDLCDFRGELKLRLFDRDAFPADETKAAFWLPPFVSPPR